MTVNSSGPKHTLPLFRFKYRNKETRRRSWTNLISVIWLLPPHSVMQLQMLQLPLLVQLWRRPFRDEASAALSTLTHLWKLTFEAERSFLHMSCRPVFALTAQSAYPRWTRSACLITDCISNCLFPLSNCSYSSPSSQWNDINLLRSNSGGNASASSVITALLRQSAHSAVTVGSRVLCSRALFVHQWVWNPFKIFRVFIPLF